MTAFGYVRKSVVHDASRMLSPETQEAAIRELAGRFGDQYVEILSDLDVSGTKRRDKRPGWDELLRAVESGEATAVYAYSLSRFARNVSQLSDFFDLCKQRKVPIRVDRDYIDTSTASGELIAHLLASVAQFEASAATERVKDAFAAKRRRDPSWRGPGNVPFGDLPGEDASVVIETFRDAGSYDQAARRLNANGFPTRKSGGVWHGSMVRDIVRRAAPDLVPPGGARGAKAAAGPFRYFRLLACGTCGTRLTPSRDSRTGLIRYYCHRAKVTPHARGWVSEHLLTSAIVGEADRAAFAIKRMQVGSADDQAKSSALASKRDRVLTNFEDGLIDRQVRDEKLAAIAADEATLSTRRWIKRIIIPPDIEKDDPGRVNEHLRRIFDRVTIDMSEPAKPGPSRWTPRLSFVWRDESLAVA